jgi:hypothetical protein
MANTHYELSRVLYGRDEPVEKVGKKEEEEK